MSALLAGLLDTAFHQALALSPQSQQEMKAYAGRCLGIHLQGLSSSLYLCFSQDKVQVLAHPPGAVDASISGAPFTLLRMMLEHNHQLLSTGAVKIEGDIHWVQAVSESLGHMDMDWEEWWAQNVGDVPAHWCGYRHRAAQQWGQESLNRMQQNVVEYLQEEIRWLPAPLEVQAFLEDVDVVRADIERLEQRIQRIGVV